MPGSTIPPDLGRETDRILRRLEARERMAGEKKVSYFSVLFSYPGELTAGIVSPPWYPDVATTFVSLRLSLLTSASVTVEVAVDGNAFDQYTLTSDLTVVHAIPNLQVTPGSYMTVEVISSSGSDMSASFKARARG